MIARAAIFCAVILALGGCSKISQSSSGAATNAWTIPGIVRLSVNTDVNTFDGLRP